MLIPIACDCGKTFRVKEEKLGKKGRCPSCGTTFVVAFPKPEPDGEVLGDLHELWQQHAMARTSTPIDLIDTSEPDEEPPIESIMPPLPPVVAAAGPKVRWPPMAYHMKDSSNRVVLVGIDISMENLFEFCLKLWFMWILFSAITGIICFILYMIIMSLIPPAPVPREPRLF